ncbi:MAG: hypothetical protein KIG94_09265, partial [Acetatifactor sp.]|nr:hypothetical protein [Acetatifactor sp.]
DPQKNTSVYVYEDSLLFTPTHWNLPPIFQPLTRFLSHPAINRLFLWQNDGVFVHPLFLSRVIMK